MNRRSLAIFLSSAVLAAVLTHGATLVAEQFSVRFGSFPGTGGGGPPEDGEISPFPSPAIDEWVLNLPKNKKQTVDFTAKIPADERNRDNYLIQIYARSTAAGPTAYGLNGYALGGGNFNGGGAGNDLRGFRWVDLTDDSMDVSRRRDDQNQHGGDYHVLVWALSEED